MNFCFNIFIVYLMCFAVISHAIVPNYCLETFNNSDCNLTPQQVFSYYKPGSRCELETWKGCPTLNKFETQEECSNMCIYFESYIADVIAVRGAVNEICLYGPIHVKRCNDNFTKVFVYNTILKSCIPITWGGCPRPRNVFKDEITCLAVCSQIKGSEIRPNQFDQIVNNFIDNISEYVEKLTNVTTKTTNKYITSEGVTESVNRNETQSTFIDILTTETVDHENKTLLKHIIKNNTMTTKKDDMSIKTSISTQTTFEKELKATDKPILDTNGTTEEYDNDQDLSLETTEALSSLDTTSTTTTTTTTTTTISETTMEVTTTKAVETTKLELSTTTTEKPEPTTQRIVTTTRRRGTAKEVVLPQDLRV